MSIIDIDVFVGGAVPAEILFHGALLDGMPEFFIFIGFEGAFESIHEVGDGHVFKGESCGCFCEDGLEVCIDDGICKAADASDERKGSIA